MSQLGTILWVKARIARHGIASIRNESLLKVSVVSTAAVMLWFGTLSLFLWAFTWLRMFLPETAGGALTIGDILMARLLSVFALALFFMLIFSNTMIAFSTFYKAREVKYMVQAPLSIPVFFLGRFMESVSFSSWASAYLGSPLIIAYGITTDAHWGYYITAILFYLPYVIIPAAIGTVFALVFVRVVPSLPRVTLFLVAGLAVLSLFSYLRNAFNPDRLAEDSVLTVVIQVASQTQSPLLPSAWATQGVLNAAQGVYGEVFFLFLLLLSTALFFTWLAAGIADKVFLSGFSSMMGSGRIPMKPLGKGILGRLDGVLGFLSDPVRPLVVKDIKLFWRDAAQWTQFVVFFGIMAVYVANLGNNAEIMRSETYKSFVEGLNIAACSLILASLTSRFAYPLISLEGFRFWILGLAPLNLKQLIWQKYWLTVCATAPFSVGLVLLSCFVLQVEALSFVMAVYSIVLANLTLAGLAVGLGSLYPNFEEDNPARIVSGMGGTLNFLLSVGYIIVAVGLQMAVTQWNALGRFANPETFWLYVSVAMTIITVFSLAGTLIPMKLGLNNLLKTEF